MASSATPVNGNCDDQSQPHRWPTVESRMAQPMIWTALLIATLFLMIGVGMTWITFRPPNPQLDPGPGGIILGVGFSGLALTAFVVLFVASRLNRPFRHAADDVLPEVPREPVLTPDQTSFSIVPLQLDLTTSGFRLVPKTNLFKHHRVFTWLWMVFISGVVSALLWLSPLQQNVPANQKILISLAFLFCGSFAVWIMTLIWKSAEQNVPSLIVDFNQCDCRIEFGTEAQTIDIDRILAIQLCTAYHHNAESWFPAVELNLVWTNDASTNKAATVWRTTLVSLSGTFYRLIPLALGLADELDVPLLNHATKAHWNLEFERSRGRPATSGGYV